MMALVNRCSLIEFDGYLNFHMDHMESEEASNDTTMISELLKSAEIMQKSQRQSTAQVSLGKDDKQGIMLQQQIMDKGNANTEIPPLTAIGHGNSTSSGGNIIMLNQGLSNSIDPGKVHHQVRHVHIPYILNGELYQIQTQDGENVTVKCCHCPPDRVYRGSVRSTGNFHMHIKRRHPDLLEKLHDMKVNALLERRDRLMRNRKVSSRNNRNRHNHVGIVASTPLSTLTGATYKEETKLNMGVSSESPICGTSPPALSLLHTHKLKIKTVFQRHQMQQREAAEMRNWNSADYVVMPIAKQPPHENTTDLPINYSLKSQEQTESQTTNVVTLQSVSQQQQQQPEPLQQLQPNSIAVTADIDCVNDVLSAPEQQPIVVENNNECIYGNQPHCTNLSTTTSQSSISQHSSDMSNFSCVNHSHHYNVIDMEPMATTTYHHTLPIHQQQPQTLSIIKPEDLLLPTEQQAIDLTLHTDSGIFSNSNESLNISQSVAHEKRAGSQHTLTTTPPVTNAGNRSPQQWQDMLLQIGTSLRDIQNEMNIRNQIESNRMFLDIAKFKFLHPAFQFNF